MSPPLHLIQLRLSTRGLYGLGHRSALSDGPSDIGYLVHAALKELFGDFAPKPFAVLDSPAERGNGKWTELLGYGATDAATLRDQAASFALPNILELLDGDRVASKPMPAFAAGRQLGFRVTVCPTVRRRHNWDGRAEGAGAEQDAYLHAIGAVPGEPMQDAPALDRRAVYREWLESAFQRTGGVKNMTAAPTMIRRVRLLRRDGEHRGRAIELPSATFEGTLTVADTDPFQDLLARGLGRHRAFGFGMLLLRPPDRS